MLTKTQFTEFRNDFAKAVASLESKYNMKIEIGNISYTDTDFHSKLTCTKLGNGGEKAANPKDVAFAKTMAGFKGEIGDKFTDYAGKKFTVVELNSRSRKFPIIVKDESGEKFKMPARYVNMRLDEKKRQLSFVTE